MKKGWLTILPFLMSLGLLALLAWGAVGPEHLPLHDEGSAEHLGMLFLIGQTPFILWNIRSRCWVAALQAAALAIAVFLVSRSEAAGLGKVQARIDAAQPFPGGDRFIGEISGLGRVQSVEFAGIDNIGWDIYEVTLEKGVRHVHLYLAKDGRLLGRAIADDAAGCVSTEIYDCRYLDRPYPGIRPR
jgi:hypothetical protein